MAQYDEDGYPIPEEAFNLRTFNTNSNNGFTGQSISPDYLSSLSKFSPNTNYGMSTTPIASDISNVGVGASSGNWWDSFIKSGTKNPDGSTNPNYAGSALGALQGLGSMYLGMKNYGLQKDQLAFGKEQFNKNYGAQRTTTNNQINERNRANQAALGTKYASSYKPLDLVA